MKNLIIIICLLVLVSGCATSKNQQAIYDVVGVIRNDIAVLQLMIINMDKYQTTGFVENVESIDSDWIGSGNWMEEVAQAKIELTEPYPEPSILWLEGTFEGRNFGLRDDGVVVWREKK